MTSSTVPVRPLRGLAVLVWISFFASATAFVFGGTAGKEIGDNLMDVKNRTLGFDKIFVISMPDRHDKKEAFSQSAIISDLKVEFVHGVKGEDVAEQALPGGWNMDREMQTLGNYRAHMNVLQKIVKDKISSALILEDNADWDVLLKTQLVNFAQGARYIQGLDQHSPFPHSPYGDDFDVLWLGHCGLRSQPVHNESRYFVTYDDPTVSPPEHRRTDLYGRTPTTTPTELQGNFTRLVYEPRNGVCAYGYGVSLRGAARLLYEMSVQPSNAAANDENLSRFCTKRLSGARCIGVFPALIDHYSAPAISWHGADSYRIRGRLGHTDNLVFPLKPNLHAFDVKFLKPTIKSQWPADTLLAQVDQPDLQLPAGQGVVLSKDQFRGKPTNNQVIRL